MPTNLARVGVGDPGHRRVHPRVRRWEPEPLRWLGVTGMYALLNAADRQEDRTQGPPSKLAALGNWLTGR